MFNRPEHSEALDTHFHNTQQMESPHVISCRAAGRRFLAPGGSGGPPSPTVPQGRQLGSPVHWDPSSGALAVQ